MQLTVTPIFAQAAGTATTNTVAPLIDLPPSMAQRFQSATGLPPEVGRWVVNISGAILILVIGAALAGIVRNLIRKLCAKRSIDPTVASFVGNLAHALIMTFVIVTALGQFGVNTTSFAAVIAAAGLAIGLALQGGLANFAAGFLIIAFRPFKAGDVVNGAGIEGVVEEVQIFSTTMNTPDNKRIIIPNSAIMGGTITNYTANATRRVDISFAIGITQDLELGRKVLLDTANRHPLVLKNPPTTVANTKLVDLGTNVELRAWTKTSDYGAVLNDLLAQCPAALAQANVKGPDKTVYYVERK